MRLLTRARAALAVPVAAAALVAGTLGPAHAAGPYDGKSVVDQGHLDVLYITNVAGQNTLVAHTDQFGNLAPEDLVLHGKPSVASRTVGAATAQLPGWPAQGATYYLLPQTSQPGQIFAGFGHNRPAGTSVTYELTGHTGDGAVALWQNGEDGPAVFLGTDAAAPQSFTSTANHEHLNWGFTAQGEHTLTVRPTVTEPGQPAQTLPAATYTFYIGEELPSDPGPDPEPDPDVALTIQGLSNHYHAGGVAVLTAVQTPATDEDHYHWFTRRDGGPWQVVSGALSDTYGFVVGTADHGMEVKAVLYDHDHAVLAESDPATIVIDDHGNDPVNGPRITATLTEEQGTLVLSVPESSREVQLSDFELNPAADRYVASGELKPIVVTDTRSANPGWSATARVRAFTTVNGDQLPGKNLGWSPTVLSSTSGQSVASGDAVAPGLDPDGPGIAGWSSLATAPAGEGTGTANLGAGLELHAPTSLVPGTYQAMMILTVI